MWANCSGCSFAHFLAKNEQFAQKTNEWIPSPGEIWPKGVRGKENGNLLTQFVQKLEQNDQKCA